MDTLEKLKILSADSQHDLACACGTGRDEHRKRGLDGKWLYPVTPPDDGYTALLKTLLSNACSNIILSPFIFWLVSISGGS